MSTDARTSPAAPADLTDRAPIVTDRALQSRYFALVYRVITLGVIITGVARITGVFTTSPSWGALRYYTVLSNLLCLAWILLLLWWTLRRIGQSGPRGSAMPSARGSGAVMMAITVTMLVYLVVLVPTTFQQAGDYVPFSLTDNLIHVITPVLLILDWLLFAPKGRLRWIDPPLWALIPYAYLAYALIYGGLGGEFSPGQSYPYPFLDVDAHGVGGVALWIAGLSVALIGVGYVFVGLDRLLARGFRADRARTGRARARD